MEPTEEEMKRVWEWCGFKQLSEGRGGYHYRAMKKVWNWLPPNETERHKSIPFLPPIDLNNLFKYAVPKTETWEYLMEWVIEMINAYADGRTLKDPALALFWAIYKVIEE